MDHGHKQLEQTLTNLRSFGTSKGLSRFIVHINFVLNVFVNNLIFFVFLKMHLKTAIKYHQTLVQLPFIVDRGLEFIKEFDLGIAGRYCM